VKFLLHEPKHIAFIALMALIAVAPMLFRGIPGGNDAIQHYEFAQQVVDAIDSGHAFPSFAGNSNHGLGDVGMRVYPPLAYYVLAAFYFVFGEWYFASIATFYLIFFIGALGVYLWANECFSARSGIAAAAVFTFAPFHLNEIYNNFLYAEFAASAVLPFCFLFAARVCRTGKLTDTVLLGIACALLIVTHLPLTVIASIALSVYAFTLIQKTNYRTILNLVGAGAVALILSGFYWVRMVTEMNWVKHSQPEYFSRIWSYSENFLFSIRTFTDFMNDGLSLWFGDLMLFAMLILCLSSIFLVRRSNFTDRTFFAITVLFAFGVVMTTPLSTPIWDNLAVLQKVQFPWRWLSVVTLAGSVIAGHGITSASEYLKDTNYKIAPVVAAATLLPFVFLSAFVMRAPEFTSRTEFNERHAELSDGETFRGWWPIWAERQAFGDKNKAIVNGRSFEVEKWDPTGRSIRFEAGEPQTVSISTFYYPLWKANISGMPAELGQDPDGRIAFQIPPDSARVDLIFSEPKIVVASAIISALGWLAAIALLFWKYRAESKIV
jgi:4-amino-4-deoxy-L-arabinose transferase-like glycosyltransferase